MKSFSRTFIFLFGILVISMCLIVILTWAIRPPSSNRLRTEEPEEEFSQPMAPDWARWLSVGLLLCGSGALGIYVFRMSRQGKDLKAVEPGQGHQVINTAGANPPPPGPAADLIRKVETLGYKPFGEYDTVFTGLNTKSTTWMLTSADNTVRAHVSFAPGTQKPTLAFSTAFGDDALVESRFPKMSMSSRKADYHSTTHDTVDKAFGYHVAKVREFTAVHGAPVVVSTFKEFSDLLIRTGSKHAPEFFRSIRQGWLTVGIILAVPLLVAAPYLIAPPPGMAPLFCVYMASGFGLIFLIVAVRSWWRTRANK